MNVHNKKVLVTGSGGLIGAAIIDSLMKENVVKIVAFERNAPPDHAELMAKWDERVQWVQGDITVKKDIERAMRDVDGVFHTAALLTPVGFDNPRAVHEVNVNGTLNILEACREYGVKKIVLSSSVSVYGRPVCDIMDEHHPLNTVTMYGVSKISNEKMCQVFHNLYGLDYIVLRYTLIYGPRLHSRANNSAFILETIRRIYQGKSPVISGDGSQMYDYLYIEDAARANIMSLGADLTDEIFNIGYGEVFSIIDIVQLILRIMGSKNNIDYQDRGWAFDVPHIRVNIEKAKGMLNFYPSVSMEDGFSRLVDWCLHQLIEK
jgi:UDP-glucose 4-epimerase